VTAFLFALTALQEPGAAQPQGNPFLTFFPFLLIFAIFYFLIIRPQSKRQKAHKALVNAIQKGDKVVSAGGIHGTVQGINEERDIVILEIADRVRIEIGRGSISRVIKE
jgi:preprotein translocase subunit YajC